MSHIVLVIDLSHKIWIIAQKRNPTKRKSAPNIFRDLEFWIYTDFCATRIFRNQFPDKSRIRDQRTDDCGPDLDHRHVVIWAELSKNPCQGQIIFVQPPSTNQSIIYYSQPLQIIEQPVTNNTVQKVFVSQQPNLNQSATAMQATISQPQSAPVQTELQSLQKKSTPCQKRLPPGKEISKYFCDFGECKLSFDSVEELRYSLRISQ